MEGLKRYIRKHSGSSSKTTRRSVGDVPSVGNNGQTRGDLDAAETWYRKALEIDERLGDEHGAAISYQNQGVVARQRGDLEAAENGLNKSLHIKQKQGNELGATYTYHQLGRLAEERRDYDTAEKWYRKAMEIYEKHGDKLGAAPTYHQLSMHCRRTAGLRYRGTVVSKSTGDRRENTEKRTKQHGPVIPWEKSPRNTATSASRTNGLGNHSNTMNRQHGGTGSFSMSDRAAINAFVYL